MTSPATLVLLLASVCALCRASNIDIISRMDRSMMPYSGSARNAFRRYRYPIYNNKRYNFYDEDEGQDSSEDDISKRFLRGMNLRPLTVRAKKPYGLSPRYDLTFTPYDLEAMDKLYRNGRRKRTPDLYDINQALKLYESGKRSSSSPYAAEDEDGDADWQKRNGDFTNAIWNAARMQEIGKRSPVTSYYDLLDMTKLAKAGKRSGVDTHSLWHLAQMQAAGKKRTINDYDLMALAKIANAGKRDGPRLAFGVDPQEDGTIDDEDQEDGDRLGAKRKRSLDDYFGWDRKKKSAGENALVDNYMRTMEKEVLGGTADKRSTSDDANAATKKKEQGNGN